ncbi:PhoH family protein [Acinetobacter sp.]|uniref:PhoH family protein n=1 Tax=Acinetobacter sp. TaxID=472 RepID=UPI003CFF38B8
MAQPKRRKKTSPPAAEQSAAQPTTPARGYQLDFTPRSEMQNQTLKIIMDHDLSFVIGPTGTGKTFLATVAALRSLYSRRSPIKKLIVVRPAVTAQEDIGFLPGGVDEKLSQFVAPVYDHIIKLVGQEEFDHLIKKGKVEVVPIGYLRGRNFDNCFVILDEAQNANIDQFKLTITRIAENGKIAVCGDIEQLDIPREYSGLVDAIPRFSDDPTFGFVALPETEIQRHPLVARILSKYKNPGPDDQPKVVSSNDDRPAAGIDLEQL